MKANDFPAELYIGLRTDDAGKMTKPIEPIGYVTVDAAVDDCEEGELVGVYRLVEVKKAHQTRELV